MGTKPAPASVVEKEGQGDQDPDGLCLVRENVTSSIKEKLMKLPPEPTGYCIYKVPERLRKANEEAFKPWVVSIGPFHRQDGRLQAMDDRKLRWFRDFFEENNNLLPIVDFIVRKESTIRQQYEDLKEINSKEFCEMILLDSIFILGLLLKKIRFEKEWTKRDIFHDMMLIENQVPLVVLCDIYRLYIKPHYGLEEFYQHVHEYFGRQLDLTTGEVQLSESPKHFVDYLRLFYFKSSNQPVCGRSKGCCSWFSSCCNFSKTTTEQQASSREIIQKGLSKTPCSCFSSKTTIVQMESCPESTQQGRSKSLCSWFPFSKATTEQPESTRERQSKMFKSPRSAEELFEAGVTFVKGEESSALDSIEFNFDRGELKIPPINVNEWTETFFRNLIAFEQCSRLETKYVSDYIVFMDSLIDTPKDVEILERKGIIKNSLNDSEQVANLINNLYKENISERNSVYDGILKALNNYNKDPWHRFKAKWYKWKVMLKNDYFQSPWSAISLIAATILLALTAIQTAFSIIKK